MDILVVYTIVYFIALMPAVFVKTVEDKKIVVFSVFDTVLKVIMFLPIFGHVMGWW